MKNIYLIGIGGSGLSAIARLLLDSGYNVAGSDQVSSPIMSELAGMGAKIYVGHHGDQVLGADLVIRSAAIPEDNPELQTAGKLGIPVQKRSAFLEEFLKGKFTIAVAGTHGKTTTTAMIAWILTAMGVDPGYLIGGVSQNLGNNACAGKSNYFVIEADEYDRMFLGLQPDIAVVTNVEHDHPDLFPTMEDYCKAFVQFMERIPHGGKLLLGQDVLTKLALPDTDNFRTYTFGLSPDASFHLRRLTLQSNGCFRFEIMQDDHVLPLAKVKLCVPGMHNVQNALAALSVIHLLGLPVSEAGQHLQQFTGVARRFEIKAEIDGITLIDDYAHHPTEIRSTLRAARDRFPEGRIIAVWQPHTFTRSKMLFSAFTESFFDADEVLVTEVYAARETDPDFSASQLSDQMQNSAVQYFSHMADLVEELTNKLEKGDVLIVLSAGSAVSINEQLIKRFCGDEVENINQQTTGFLEDLQDRDEEF